MIPMLFAEAKVNFMYLLEEVKGCPCGREYSDEVIHLIDINERYTLWDLNQIIYN